MDNIISLCKRRGFIFPGSEIYGGLANSWDYGPLGAQLRKNIKDFWWKKMVEEREDMVGFDGAIMMNPRVWEASGHVATFHDPLVECKKCNSRFRADNLIDDEKSYIAFSRAKRSELLRSINSTQKSVESIHDKVKKLLEVADIVSDNSAVLKSAEELIEESTKGIETTTAMLSELDKPIGYGFIGFIYLNKYINCPNCNGLDWLPPREFNMMFKTTIGTVQEEGSTVYLRPETAQAMFVNFKNVALVSRKRLPFGIAQIGKAFRNEITPGNFIFRTLEFEQMEIEYFIEEKDWQELFEKWIESMESFAKEIGIDTSKLHRFEVPDEDRAHYSKRTIDFMFDFPFGNKELWGLAYRGNFDLTQHQEFSKQNLEFTDPDDNKRKLLPHVIEPSQGVDRTFLALLVSVYNEEVVKEGDTRVVLKFPAHMAPYQVAVLPLMKKDGLAEKGKELFKDLLKDFRVEYDDAGSIGKRYRREDEIGTPFCVTVDYDTFEDNAVTVRDRDSMTQERVKIDELKEYLQKKFLN